MGWFNDIVTVGTGGVISPDHGLSLPGVGVYQNTSLKDSDAMDFVPGIGDARAQDKANEQNLTLDRMNRDWMERMSNSAYQRAMDDMKKAGLNPMLAYQQGGASVPNTSAPVVQASSKTGLASAALGAFTGISSAQSQIQNANTAQATAQSSIALQGAQTAQTVAQTEKTQAETARTIDSIKNQKVQRELMNQQKTMTTVKASAMDMANKGLSTLEKVSNNVLKNTAKPSVDKKTLEYKNPLNPMNWNVPGFNKPFFQKD